MPKQDINQDPKGESNLKAGHESGIRRKYFRIHRALAIKKRGGGGGGGVLYLELWPVRLVEPYLAPVCPLVRGFNVLESGGGIAEGLVAQLAHVGLQTVVPERMWREL